MVHMERDHSNNYEILASKRLTKSFTRINDLDIWGSMSLSYEQTKEILNNVLSKLGPDSEPLTITITRNNTNEDCRKKNK